MFLINPYFSYTPRHWEFGVGFYLGSTTVNGTVDNNYTYNTPSEIALLVGPFSFCIEFAKH